MKLDLWLVIVIAILVLLIGLFVGFYVNHNIELQREEKDAKSAKKLIDDANERAEEIINNATIQAKNLTLELKQHAEAEAKDKRAELAAQEQKIAQREATIDRRDMALIDRENNLNNKIEECNRRLNKITEKEKIVEQKEASIDGELQRIASLNVQEARDIILEKVESKMAIEIATIMKQKEDEAKETCDVKAKEMLSLAMAKYSQEVVTERTVSVVAIPSDEMKGRIIGREGRNIRTLEQLLGVDIIIDDTPEVIQVW